MHDVGTCNFPRVFENLANNKTGFHCGGSLINER